jgi:hypothetical protein
MAKLSRFLRGRTAANDTTAGRQNRRWENRLAFSTFILQPSKCLNSGDEKTVGAAPAAVPMPHFLRFVRSALLQAKTK